ncbi:hypothetical protein AB4Y45_41135 [Paraburkholderia sp. EG287A]|uniref:hypothetical protein n=1 Tax=unclassified Paraburkholderia TaxID=2615204 RepID=UPI0034D2015F
MRDRDAERYSGHPVCAAAALANPAIIEREKLVENAAKVGSYFGAKLVFRSFITA